MQPPEVCTSRPRAVLHHQGRAGSTEWSTLTACCVCIWIFFTCVLLAATSWALPTKLLETGSLSPSPPGLPSADVIASHIICSLDPPTPMSAAHDAAPEPRV